MSDRAQQLADQLQQANEDVIAFVEAASPRRGESGARESSATCRPGQPYRGWLWRHPRSLVLPVAEGRPGPSSPRTISIEGMPLRR
jgi:hypothetical protein